MGSPNTSDKEHPQPNPLPQKQEHSSGFWAAFGKLFAALVLLTGALFTLYEKSETVHNWGESQIRRKFNPAKVIGEIKADASQGDVNLDRLRVTLTTMPIDHITPVNYLGAFQISHTTAGSKRDRISVWLAEKSVKCEGEVDTTEQHTSFECKLSAAQLTALGITPTMQSRKTTEMSPTPQGISTNTKKSGKPKASNKAPRRVDPVDAKESEDFKQDTTSASSDGRVQKGSVKDEEEQKPVRSKAEYLRVFGAQSCKFAGYPGVHYTDRCTWSCTIWVYGDPQSALDSVASVTYQHQHSSFVEQYQNGVVKNDRNSQFQDTVKIWGTYPLVARITFDDGSSYDQQIRLSFPPVPGTCPNVWGRR